MIPISKDEIDLRITGLFWIATGFILIPILNSLKVQTLL